MIGERPAALVPLGLLAAILAGSCAEKSLGNLPSAARTCVPTACPAPAPGAPAQTCRDGTTAGPQCVATDAGCGWIVTVCPPGEAVAGRPDAASATGSGPDAPPVATVADATARPFPREDAADPTDAGVLGGMASAGGARLSRCLSTTFAALARTPCETEEDVCEYDEGACTCRRCPALARVCDTSAALAWDCVQPGPGCPPRAASATPGTPCPRDGLTCHYACGAGGLRSCRAGQWTADEGPCAP
jgi:hypothetical protein